jgi:hypothetical protein
LFPSLSSLSVLTRARCDGLSAKRHSAWFCALHKLVYTGRLALAEQTELMADLSIRRIVVGITGGIAAYKAAELVRLLVKGGVEVQVVMTPSACGFIARHIQALSGSPYSPTCGTHALPITWLISTVAQRRRL